MTDAFSVYGPQLTLPWVAVVDGGPMLLWARNRAEAEGLVSAHHRNPTNVRLFRVNPRHHLGTARVVPLTEIGE